MILHTLVIWPSTLYPDKAGMEHFVRQSIELIRPLPVIFSDVPSLAWHYYSANLRLAILRGRR